MSKDAWTKRGNDLDEDVGLLIAALCSEWGFCNGLLVSEILPSDAALTADQFAAAVLTAEGMDPRPGAPHYLEIRRAFMRRYGPTVSRNTFTL